MTNRIFEGTWEEAVRRTEEFAGRRVRITLLPPSERVASQHPTTGAAVVAYWKQEGVIGMRPDITDSAAHAREIRRQAERQTRS